MSESPIVTVEQGQIQGRTVTCETGKSFYSFQGIPYAKAPLGSLRFKAPQPLEPWDDVRDCTAEGNVCAQFDPITYQSYIGDENCLFLNVYTPNLDGEFLPVMIFIHGGGYQFGSGNTRMYGPDYLVDRDVVLVTINYRCNALGFLCLNTPEVPGNAGLKDMVQAIRWVKSNIHKFGGNSSNITIFGESAGGAAVSTLTASPLTKDLISKAVIQSGTALSSWTSHQNPLKDAMDLVKELGCESEDVDEILEFLTTTPVRELVEAANKLNSIELFLEKGQNRFVPVIEKEFPGVEAVLTESFIDVLTSGRTSNVPIMIGQTTLEFTNKPKNYELDNFVPSCFNLEKDSEDAAAIMNDLKRLYFSTTEIGPENHYEYSHLLSDKLICVDTYRYIRYLVQVSNKPIYYYNFDYVGELNIMKILSPEKDFKLKYAAHADELGYLFKNYLQEKVQPTSQDIKMRERMIRLWTNFAKTGDPTPDQNHFITCTWKPVTKDTVFYLNLGSELILEQNLKQEKMTFWENLYSKYYKIWDHPKANNQIVPERVSKPVDEAVIAEAAEVLSATEIVDNAVAEPVTPQNGHVVVENGNMAKPTMTGRTSKEIKMVGHSNGDPKDVIRANDPPEDDLPKNVGVNKFVNFFESLGGKK